MIDQEFQTYYTLHNQKPEKPTTCIGRVSPKDEGNQITKNNRSAYTMLHPGRLQYIRGKL
jgi:hypothetical protein